MTIFLRYFGAAFLLFLSGFLAGMKYKDSVKKVLKDIASKIGG